MKTISSREVSAGRLYVRPYLHVDMSLGPWMGLCLICLNFSIAVCDQVLINNAGGVFDSATSKTYQQFSNIDITKFAVKGGSIARSLPVAKRTVVSRKGVTESSSVPAVDKDAQVNNSPLDESLSKGFSNIKAMALPVNYSSVLEDNVKPSSSNNSSTVESSRKISNITSVVNVPSNKVPYSLVGVQTLIGNSQNVSAAVSPISSSTSFSRKKSKPGVTFDVDDLPRDANGKIVVSGEDVVSSDPSADFVVPVVLALLALPLVVVLGAFLYKKSRDFWERRHYRRMDFLIEALHYLYDKILFRSRTDVFLF